MIGIRDPLEQQVLRLADLAQTCGLDGIVCSPFEIPLIRKHFGYDFKLVVPGIRPAGTDKGDQKRIMTPAEALEQSADYLVIGRPISQHADPRAAAKAIQKDIRKVLR